jgi:hypothetical protein
VLKHTVILLLERQVTSEKESFRQSQMLSQLQDSLHAERTRTSTLMVRVPYLLLIGREMPGTSVF